MTSKVTVIGGGLAGCEAAYQLATRGIHVDLYEMRPQKTTPAHTTDMLAELVCSNSLGASGPTSPAGILKQELGVFDSIIMDAARRSSVPAGRALAVDRNLFAQAVTDAVSSHANISVIREELHAIPDGNVILATGPLTSAPMAEALQQIVGCDFMAFHDAVAPIITLESVNSSTSYRGSRYEQGEDYINCPMDKETYLAFQAALLDAQQAPRHGFESAGKCQFFEGCLPIEEIARRGVDTLRFGPMRPVGLPNPTTGEEPYAVVQLRQDNAEGTLYNMVGFQTNLLWGEQDRVFRMIPALDEAHFERHGVMHRNLFVCAPRILDGFLRPSGHESLFLAGQITGVEGYMESTAMGLAAALFMYQKLKGLPLTPWPRETAIGALLHYLKDALPKSFQPMNVNLGIFPKLDQKIKDRRERCTQYAARSSFFVIPLREKFATDSEIRCP